MELSPRWKGRPVLIVSSDDAFRAEAEAIVAAARAADALHLQAVHLAGDHAYSDQRVALAHLLINWLAGFAGAAASER